VIAKTVAADIRAGDGEATTAKIDVTNEAEWIDLITKVVAAYGGLAPSSPPSRWQKLVRVDRQHQLDHGIC
jgi:hypothetical protein